MEEKHKRSRIYRRHSFAERKQAIDLHAKGFSSKIIAQKLDLDDSMVRAWIRKYRVFGEMALEPYWRSGRSKDSFSASRLMEKEDQFRKAYPSYANSLEPIASIVRRYNLEYHSFKYHVERYHPELVAARDSLRTMIL